MQIQLNTDSSGSPLIRATSAKKRLSMWPSESLAPLALNTRLKWYSITYWTSRFAHELIHSPQSVWAHMQDPKMEAGIVSAIVIWICSRKIGWWEDASAAVGGREQTLERLLSSYLSSNARTNSTSGLSFFIKVNWAKIDIHTYNPVA
jgi:hypothetical protein